MHLNRLTLRRCLCTVFVLCALVIKAGARQFHRRVLRSAKASVFDSSLSWYSFGSDKRVAPCERVYRRIVCSGLGTFHQDGGVELAGCETTYANVTHEVLHNSSQLDQKRLRDALESTRPAGGHDAMALRRALGVARIAPEGQLLCAGTPVQASSNAGLATPICIYDRVACKAKVESVGLKTSRASGSNFAFVGNYATKGCYAYSSGEWRGEAYYGTIDGVDVTRSDQLNNEFFEGGYRMDACDGSTSPVLFAPGGAGLAPSVSMVADTVMGGRSQSRTSYTSEGILFQGDVTKDGGGGFASVRLTPSDGAALVRLLQSGTGVAFNVRHITGCASWKLQLNGNGNWLEAAFGQGWVQWQSDFIASDSGALQQIAFSDLVPTRYGKPLGGRGLSSTDMGSISNLGFMLSFLDDSGALSSSFQEGPFALTISLVAVY